MINEPGLTADERECLRFWFRQAIGKLEQEEVTAQFIKNDCLQPEGNRHRSSLVKRRSPRTAHKVAHARELVT
ncbi:MAG TPA: hypothetical protein V6C81_09385 [Planktothrix sp.]